MSIGNFFKNFGIGLCTGAAVGTSLALMSSFSPHGRFYDFGFFAGFPPLFTFAPPHCCHHRHEWYW